MEQCQGLCYNITCGVRVSLCWFIVYLVAVFAGNKGGYFLFSYSIYSHILPQALRLALKV